MAQEQRPLSMTGEAQHIIYRLSTIIEWVLILKLVPEAIPGKGNVKNRTLYGPNAKGAAPKVDLLATRRSEETSRPVGRSSGGGLRTPAGSRRYEERG